MKKPLWIVLAVVSLSVVMFSGIDYLSSAELDRSKNGVSYTFVERSQYTIHLVTIPHDSRYLVTPEISGELQPIQDFIGENIVAAINGGYFDPVNQKTTSFVVQRSQIVADPRFNERLIDNPDLKPYLGKILNRAEFRRYSCGEETQYDIQPHFSPIPPNCTLKESLGGGPSLLPKNTSVTEGFTAYQDGKKIRDAIGSDGLNARSAVGITDDGDIILAMVAQQTDLPLDSGISLPELAEVLSSFGATKAMNLDGGSSTALYYDGKATYGRVDQEGNEIQRPIKSVLLVTES
ncbi:phosphodiester glycosidase family protein [Pleurocapsales cyanobacterium LEGE 10410]|nr:phosphodiester glycosidase family protein [Pleurocapsales cyanobacterium LEGE 10410]